MEMKLWYRHASPIHNIYPVREHFSPLAHHNINFNEIEITVGVPDRSGPNRL